MTRFFLAAIIFAFTLISCHESDVTEFPDVDVDIVEDDDYIGNAYQIEFGEETANFMHSEFTCYISTSEGVIIKRSGSHQRQDNISTLTLTTGLKEGVYRMLYLEYETPEIELYEYAQHGLGCRIEINSDSQVTILDNYDSSITLSGSGTSSDPYIISSYEHLERMRILSNDDSSNDLFTKSTHFLQSTDIDMDMASWSCDNNSGWLPIGATHGNPFRGVYDGGGYTITGLWSKRPNSSGIGLFGFAENSVFKNITIYGAEMEGWYGTATLLGAAMVPGDDITETTVIYNCTTKRGSVTTQAGGAGTGGLVGVVDMYSNVLIMRCSNESTPVTGAYGVGGLIGAGSFYSNSSIVSCENSADVTSYNSGAGGLIGSADSLLIIGSVNEASIMGSTMSSSGSSDDAYIGTGGLVGGSGSTYIYSSTNEGDVSGYMGVGGLVGSARVGTSDYLIYNSAVISYGKNSGTVTGYNSVGGLCGEAQFGCYGGFNEGAVKGSDSNSDMIIGGIVGNSSYTVIYNTINSGSVWASQAKAIGGIIGQTTNLSTYTAQNFGSVEATCDSSDNNEGVGGIVGLSGNYSILNFCSNAGVIKNNGTGATGGIVGQIGDPRVWSAADIANCVVGGVECLLAVLGPAITVASGALEGASHAVELVEKFVHISEKLVDLGAILSEAGLFIDGVCEMLSEEEVEIAELALNVSLYKHSAEIEGNINSYRSSVIRPSGMSSTLFDDNAYTQYNKHITNAVDFFEASSSNNELVNLNLNLKREERYEEIEKAREIRDIVQKIIGGACMLAASVAFVASMVATGGTAAPITFAAFASVASLIGGVNAIVEGAADYQMNSVIISQCLNAGEIDAPSSDYVGGIVGVAHDYSLVNDSANASEYVSSNTRAGAIGGMLKSKCDVSSCVQVGNGWPYQSLYYTSYSPTGNIYYYEDVAEKKYNDNNTNVYGLSLEYMSDKSRFKGFDFDSETALWYHDNSLQMPVPYNSEMTAQIEVEEE